MILLHLVCLRRVVVLEEEEKLPKLRTPSLRDDVCAWKKVMKNLKN
jgi:hypothetical protein